MDELIKILLNDLIEVTESNTPLAILMGISMIDKYYRQTIERYHKDELKDMINDLDIENTTISPFYGVMGSVSFSHVLYKNNHCTLLSNNMEDLQSYLNKSWWFIQYSSIVASDDSYYAIKLTDTVWGKIWTNF